MYSLALGDAFGSVLAQGTLLLGILATASKEPLEIAPVRHVIPFLIISYVAVGTGIRLYGRVNRALGIALLTLYGVFLLRQYAVVMGYL